MLVQILFYFPLVNLSGVWILTVSAEQILKSKKSSGPPLLFLAFALSLLSLHLMKVGKNWPKIRGNMISLKSVGVFLLIALLSTVQIAQNVDGQLSPPCGSKPYDYNPIDPNQCKATGGIKKDACLVLNRKCTCQTGFGLKWTAKACSRGSGDGVRSYAVLLFDSFD